MRRTPSPRIHTNNNQLGDWQTHTACGPDDADLFFPISYTDPASQFQIRAAKAICTSCPVRLSCQDDALEREGRTNAENRNGIWGGLDPYERAELVGAGKRGHHRRAA